MTITKLISFATLLLSVATASGQSILKDYFKGNKDSMVIEATKLINLPDPTFKPFQSNNIDSAGIKNNGNKHTYKAKPYYFTVRDNKKIFAYQFQKKSNNTIILIHGVKSKASFYNETAGLLRSAAKAEVFAIDLRGHGKSAGKDGDVDYINQYADDLADIIKTIRKQKPTGKIIIAGHSMGGGVALSYALQKNEIKVDGYLLLAPLLGQNSPAISQSAQTETDSLEPFMKIHIPRIIGLKMFNEIDNHTHDSLPVLFFNLPENMPSRKYTYRANMSMAPEDYKDGLKAVNVPMLVLIGNKDEAFNADAMKKAVSENSKGVTQIIDGATHDGIINHPEAFNLIKQWFSSL